MSDKVYRIKPLVWEKRGTSFWIAKTIFGDAEIYGHDDGFDFWPPTGDQDPRFDDIDTLEAAQLAAEQWHRERMAAGLVEVVNGE